MSLTEYHTTCLQLNIIPLNTASFQVAFNTDYRNTRYDLKYFTSKIYTSIISPIPSKCINPRPYLSLYLSHSQAHSHSHTLTLSHTYTLIHTHTHAQTNTHTFTHTHLHSHTHTHIHTHIHTLTHTHTYSDFVFNKKYVIILLLLPLLLLLSMQKILVSVFSAEKWNFEKYTY
jgi:hypothetical protein